MTVTLPRALEVCGVTRSIKCPFKCVPYKSKLYCTMKSHITTFLYSTNSQLCPTLILKGKECKASSERAQGQRAAHKGRGSHLSSVVPLHICCRLPQRVTNPLSTGPRPVYSQISVKRKETSNVIMDGYIYQQTPLN